MLTEGMAAPDFTLAADGGGNVSLSDFRGKSVVEVLHHKPGGQIRFPFP
jgi:peroxiredoxin